MILLSANSGFDDFSFSELNALEQEKCERFYFVENRNFELSFDLTLKLKFWPNSQTSDIVYMYAS